MYELSKHPCAIFVVVFRELYQHLRYPPLRDPVCYNVVNQKKAILENHGVFGVGKQILEICQARVTVFQGSDQ